MHTAEDAQSTPLMSASDPYYVVKDELVAKIGSLQTRLESFQDVLYNTNTAANPAFKEQRKQLGRELRGAESQLKDLGLTVEYVVRDRATFAHIDDRELEDRKAFISEAGKKLGAIREAATGDRARRKIQADEKALVASREGNYGARSSVEMANTDYIHGQHARTRQVLQDQDENIDQLGGAVDRIHNMASEIHGELRTQTRLIEDLEADMDETTEKMNFVMGKLAKLLKTKDSCQLWTIIILTVVLVLLVMIFIWS